MLLNCADVVLPLQSTLYFLFFLVGLFYLVSYFSKKFLKGGQEVRLISPELGPKAAHLTWTGE